MPTLEQLQGKMKKLQAQADALIAKNVQSAVDQIRKIMLTHGLTTADIEEKAKARRDAKALDRNPSPATKKVAKSPKLVASPKYQHPKTGATWTGHGRAPAWIANAKDRTKFLIATGADVALLVSADPLNKATPVAKKSKPVANAVGNRGQRIGPQPAKYLDPKTGATWSGKGPAPAWLAAAKDRNAFLIAGAASTEISFVSKVDRSKSSTASAPVAKKATTRKVAAKKASAKKRVLVKVAAKKTAINKTSTKKAASAGKTALTKRATRKSPVETDPANGATTEAELTA